MIDTIWLWLSRLKVLLGAPSIAVLLLLVGVNLFCSMIRQNRRIASFALTAAQFVAFGNAAMILSYGYRHKLSSHR
jgi:hypothetical protein